MAATTDTYSPAQAQSNGLNLMAHYAKLIDNIVVDVITVSNEVVGDYPESDAIGQAFIASLGIEGYWLETSYNGNFRGVYAGIGYTYDPALDEFVAPPEPPYTPSEPTDETPNS